MRNLDKLGDEVKERLANYRSLKMSLYGILVWAWHVATIVEMCMGCTRNSTQDINV